MKKVKVIFPDGSIADIDESELSAALSAGAKRHTEKSTTMVFKDGSIADISENDLEGAMSAGAVKKKAQSDVGIDAEVGASVGGTVGTFKAQSRLPVNEENNASVNEQAISTIGTFKKRGKTPDEVIQSGGNAIISTPSELFSAADKEELTRLSKKNNINPFGFNPINEIKKSAGLDELVTEETVSYKPFVSEMSDVIQLEKNLSKQAAEKRGQLSTNYFKDDAKTIQKTKAELAAIEDEIKITQTLKKKAAGELAIEGEELIEANIRTDNSGNDLNKLTNRLALISPTSSIQGWVGLSQETTDRIDKLPTQFVTGLNYLKNAEPVVFERITDALKNGLPISESQVANITQQGLELEQARLTRKLQKEEISPLEYQEKVLQLNTVRKHNVLDNQEILRAFLSDGAANILDEIGKKKQGDNPLTAVPDYVFGHTWNYSDNEIKFATEKYAKDNGLDPQDGRIQNAIKYLQDNEGSMIMQNSVAKAGGVRELFKGATEPIKGISNSIEDLAKSSNDVYVESQSQGNVNVAEKRLKSEDTGVRGIVNDVVKGTGQFVTQAGIAYLTSGAVGLAAEGIASNIIGKTLLGTKDGIATYVTSYAQSYDSNLKNALSYTSDNQLAKQAAAINSSIEGATELFLSPLDIAKGIASKFRSKGTTEGLLKILSEKNLTQNPDKLRDFLTATLKGVGGTAKVAGAEIGEEYVTQIADYVTNAYLNPNSETFQNRDLQNELAVTAYQTGVSMAIPALLNGIGAANANTFSKGALLVAAQNRQKLIEGLNEDLALNNIDQAEYNQKAQIINTAEVANAELPLKADGSKLNTDEKADYIFSRVSEDVMKNKIEKSKDEAEKRILEGKIKEQQDFRTELLGTTTPVSETVTEEVITEQPVTETETELTNEEQVAIEGFKGVDFGTGSITNWTNIVQSETATPQEKKLALKELGEQLADKNSEVQIGEALGKSVDLIYAINDANGVKGNEGLTVPAPVESKEVGSNSVVDEGVGKNDFDKDGDLTDAGFDKVTGILKSVINDVAEKYDIPVKALLNHYNIIGEKGEYVSSQTPILRVGEGQEYGKLINMVKKIAFEMFPDKIDELNRQIDRHSQELLNALENGDKTFEVNKGIGKVYSALHEIDEKFNGIIKKSLRNIELENERRNPKEVDGNFINSKQSPESSSNSKEAEALSSKVAEGQNLEISDKNIKLQNNETGTAQKEGISSGQNEGGTDNPQRPEKEKSITERINAIDYITDPYDRVLEHFSKEGKIHSSAIEKIFGGKDSRIRQKSSTESEKRARISLVGKDAPTIEKLAHQLWESDETGNHTAQDYKDAIERVLLEYNSKSSMQKDLVERYDFESAAQKYYEQNQEPEAQQAIDIATKLTDEQVNELLRMDAENISDAELIAHIELLQNEKTNSTENINTEKKSSDTAPTVSEDVSKTKKTDAKSKEQRINEFNEKADKVANSLIDFLTPKSTRGATKSGMGIEEIVKGATAAIKKAYAISQNIADAVEAGIQYFKDNWTESELGELPEQDLRNKLTDDLEETAEPKSATNPKQNKSGKLTDVEVGIIREVLDKNIDAREFPTLFDMNQTLTQQTAKTQGEGQDRQPLDGTYIQAHLQDLRSISLNNARILQDGLGKDWKEKVIGFLEDNPTAGNIAQVSGLLNVINTDVYNEIAASKNGTEISKLKNLQDRADRITYDTSRSASLALNQRRMYQDFGQGKDVADILSSVILTPEQVAIKSKVEEALKQKFTDEELNKPKPPKPKKPTQPKPAKPKATKSDDSVKKDLISNGQKAAQQTDADGNVTIVSLKDKIQQANEALNGFKC